MIPVSLDLKNFLSYGSDVPTLDFSQFHVVCLSGDNGHGKSALLDAITWAAWGEARKAAGDRKPDERLLRMGATEMSVAYVFDVETDQAESSRYRILRQYQSGRGGKSTLEFQMHSLESQQYRTLTQTSATATQKLINDTLRMDYTTFVNSVFIVQGRADEFTNRSARERKEILADILGLWRYDELQEQARAHGQQAAQNLHELKRQISEIDDVTADEARCHRAVDDLKAEIGRLQEQKTGAASKLDNVLGRRVSATEAGARIKKLQSEIDDLGSKRQTLADRLTAVDQELAGFSSLLRDRGRIEKDHLEYLEMTRRCEELNQMVKRDRQLGQQKASAEKSIESERHELERNCVALRGQLEGEERTISESKALLDRRNEIEQRFENLRKAHTLESSFEGRRPRHGELQLNLREASDQLTSARSAVQGEIKGLRVRHDELTHRAKQIDALREKVTRHEKLVRDLQELDASQREIEGQGRALNGQMEILKNKIRMFQHEDADSDAKLTLLRHGKSINCPLCDAALDERRRESIEVNIGKSVRLHAEEIQRHQKGIKVYQEEREALALKFKTNRPRLEELPAALKDLAAAQNAVRECSVAANGARDLTHNISQLERSLGDGGFAPELHARVTAIQQQIAELAYDAAAHDGARKEARDLQPYESDKSRLDDALEKNQKALLALPGLKRDIDGLSWRIQEGQYADEARKMLEEATDAMVQLGYDADTHQDIEKQLSNMKDLPGNRARLDEAIRKSDTARETAGRIRESLSRADATLERHRKDTADLTAVAGQEDALAGEIAMLRESLATIQWVSDEANRRLGGEQARSALVAEAHSKRPQLQSLVDKAAHDVQIYDKLTTAFGKDGIQALIIESAIPEIENESNRILSRLTGNRTQISIEPLRNLKTGGTRETLDIHISDEMGTRPYELYSGGEAFRTNFAMRIALSKLLAGRAGTRLRTLIIDEGFGTQDAEGLEYLIEALHEVRSDFDKIIVVTHLDRLKKAFPARIEITKCPDTGSFFQVVT